MAIFLKNFTKYCRIAEQKVVKTFEFFNTELDTEWTLQTGILNSNFEHIDFVSLAEKGELGEFPESHENFPPLCF